MYIRFIHLFLVFSFQFLFRLFFRAMSSEASYITVEKTLILLALSLSFVAGTLCGYQFKTWKMEWLKRKRDRLARKIQKTQKEIEALQNC